MSRSTARLMFAGLLLTVVLLPGCTAMLLGGHSAQAQNNGPAQSDAAITVQVRNRLAMDQEVEAERIEVTTHRRVVFLDGWVPSAEQAARAATVAERVAGVERVINDLRTPEEDEAEEDDDASGFLY